MTCRKNLKKNPKGSIPTLEDGEHFIIESISAARYICFKGGDKGRNGRFCCRPRTFNGILGMSIRHITRREKKIKINLHIMKILLHFLMIASKIGKRSESMITERKKKLPLILQR